MRKFAILANSTALATFFMSDSCETVVIKGAGGNVRVNKSDYDADQAEGGKGEMTLAAESTQAKNPESIPFGTVTNPAIPVPPAPSAPAFDDRQTSGIAPDARGVATATIPSVNTIGVVKDGKKFYPVIVQTGERMVHDLVDVKGYDSEKAAWDAGLSIPR